MSSDPVFDLGTNPVHLGLGARVVREPAFTGHEWYQAYSERHASDGVEGRLVSLHTFTEPWDSWEVHPDGEATVIQEIDGGTTEVVLRAGQAVINPPGVWHTADIAGSARMLFITAGEGTEGRPR